MIEADLELAAGQPTAAEAVLRESYEFMSPTAETGYIATIVDYRAVAALEQRRDDEALAFADEVERLAQPEDFEPHVRQACVRARVLARRGDHDAAAKTIQAAVARGGECDYFTVLAYAAISLAEVERLAGRLDPERRALDEALDLCKQKGDLLTAARVREQLAELSSVASP
jgi:ATP/maltotriose-dependent transcriptional regulator MalT